MEDIKTGRDLELARSAHDSLSIAICREGSSRGSAKTTIRFPVCDVGNGLEIATKAQSLAAGRSKELDGTKSRRLETARADAIRVNGEAQEHRRARWFGEGGLCIRRIGKTGGSI